MEHLYHKSLIRVADSDEDGFNSSDKGVTFNNKSKIQVESYHLPKTQNKKKYQTPPREYGYADLILYALTTSYEIIDEEPKSSQEVI